MIVDGKQIAEDLKRQLAKSIKVGGNATLAVVAVGDDPTSAKFVERKRQFALDIGVPVMCFEYNVDISQDELIAEVTRISAREDIQGVVVQLPLPVDMRPQEILKHIPSSKDVDALSPSPIVLSPVVGAINTIFERHGVELAGKHIVIVGQGALVGRPTALYLAAAGYDVAVADIATEDLAATTQRADILILGCGSPHLIRPEIIKSGVVLIDAGTSVLGGKLMGDAHPDCAEKAALFTPVPGGVGPITIAMLFQNLLELSARQQSAGLF
jgi:methylenetetrahydrofolate dehydrogenase (NADP+) / methenyltetrahydrofolate cyclohydrolase